MKLEFLADYPEAIPQVAQWYFNQWDSKVGDSLDVVEARLRDRLNKHRAPLSIIAKSGSEILGVAELRIRKMEIFPEREFWLGGVYVSPSARGQGIAAALASRVADVARTLHISEVYLQTRILTGGLYANLGWRLEEIIEHKGRNLAIMVRSLSE